MKIAIFENEYALVEPIFDSVNIFYYNNSLEYEVFQSSQSIGDINNVNQYKLVVIDLDLSQKSEADGYTLISKIMALPVKPPIAVITGASKVRDSLIQRQLPDDFPVVAKPPSVEELHNVFVKLGIR
jgi:DNA-binding response OmpR family regulator